MMRGFLILLLVGVAVAAPTSNESGDDEVITIDENFFPDEFVKYRSEHDIVNILVPINSLNFDEDDSSESKSDENDSDVILFFVEADVTDDGKKIDQGLYVFKENKAKKLLDNGRDVAASADDSKLVFFGASDGLYVYNEKKNIAEKYGSINDNIITLAKEKSGDVIYILTENNLVYKVTDNGNVKEKIDDIVNAKQIVLDYSNNIYFYSDDKQPYVRTSEGVTKINGLPENPSHVALLKPPFLLEDAVPFIADNIVYLIYANGTSEPSGFQFNIDKKPTAYSMEAALIQYFAYDKKIYEYNVLAIVLGSVLEELKNYLNDKSDTIQSLATQRRRSIQANA